MVVGIWFWRVLDFDDSGSRLILYEVGLGSDLMSALFLSFNLSLRMALK